MRAAICGAKALTARFKIANVIHSLEKESRSFSGFTCRKVCQRECHLGQKACVAATDLRKSLTMSEHRY